MHCGSYARRLWLPSLLIVYLLLGLSTVFGKHGALHLWKVRQDLSALEARVFVLLQENEEVRSRIYRFRTEPGFVEQVVREKLGYVKDGEMVYRFGSIVGRIPRGPGAVNQPDR